MPPTPKLRDSGNDLLDRLPADEFDALQPTLQRMSLTIKQVVHQSGVDLVHVYFPTTALISLLTVLRDDDPVEAATVGRDGFVGLAASLGIMASPHRAICQMTGDSLRVPVHSSGSDGARPGLTRLPTRNRVFLRLPASRLRATRSIPWSAGQPLVAGILTSSRGDEFAMTRSFWFSCRRASSDRHGRCGPL